MYQTYVDKRKNKSSKIDKRKNKSFKTFSASCLTYIAIVIQQGKSERFDICDQPRNFA